MGVIDVTIKNRSLGLQSGSDGEALCIVGPANDGPTATLNGSPVAGAINVPLLYGQQTDVQADYDGGPLVEAGALALEVIGRPVILCRTDVTTSGAQSDLNTDNVAGTGVVTLTEDAEPDDDYELFVNVITGVTLGGTGGEYQYSEDGGRTMSPTLAIPISGQIALPGGASYDIDPPEDEVTALIALVLEARADALAHFNDSSVHDAADTAAIALITSGAPTTAEEAIAVLVQLGTAWAAHLSNLTVHNGPDGVNVLTTATPTTATSAVARVIEWKTVYNAHLGIALAASTAGLKAATATVAAPVTLTTSDLLSAGLDLLAVYARKLKFTTAGVTASDAPATATIIGTDYLGAAQTEIVNLAQTATSVISTKAFKTITSIAYPAADGTGATVAIGYDQAVHNSADSTNTVSGTVPAQGTLVANDNWTSRGSAPKWNDAQLDAALAQIQVCGYRYKSILILGNVTSTATANSIGTRFTAMRNAYVYKKLFGHYRMPNVAESESAYLAAFKAVFDPVTCDGLYMGYSSFEVQSSAVKPRIYRRPPSWMAAMMHVVLGPSESLGAVNDGAGAWGYGSTIKDVNGNPKHHDERLNAVGTAARGLALTTHPGYGRKVFVALPRSLADFGTDFMLLQYWAVMIEVLDVAVPTLIGLIQAKGLPDPETARIEEGQAQKWEGRVKERLDAIVVAAGHVVSCAVKFDRTVNVFSTPKLPVEITAIPFFYPEGFKLTVALNNPAYKNT